MIEYKAFHQSSCLSKIMGWRLLRVDYVVLLFFSGDVVSYLLKRRKGVILTILACVDKYI